MPKLFDASVAHYFAARETDSMFTVPDPVTSGAATNGAEKFLFYRGVGSFATPLRATMPGDGLVNVTNSNLEPLSDLFIVRVSEGRGSFVHVKTLEHGKNLGVPLPGAGSKDFTKQNLADKLSLEMASALQRQGLYPKEARAMVKTWDTSWFQEDGIRVLYLLPRKWTDKTLPLSIAPAPNEIVRVMVGRAELLSNQTETNLKNAITDAARGDANARRVAIQQLRNLGRFAESAVGLATRNLKPNEVTEGYNLLTLAVKPVASATSASL